MSDRPQLRVICYDIASDKIRARISDHLDGVAARVQYSVYEARLSGRAVDALFKTLRTMADPDDSIRVYTVPDRALRACWQNGGVAVTGAGRSWII